MSAEVKVWADLLQRGEVALCEEPVLPRAGGIGPDPSWQLDSDGVLTRSLRHPLHLVELLEVLRQQSTCSDTLSIIAPVTHIPKGSNHPPVYLEQPSNKHRV